MSEDEGSPKGHRMRSKRQSEPAVMLTRNPVFTDDYILDMAKKDLVNLLKLKVKLNNITNSTHSAYHKV